LLYEDSCETLLVEYFHILMLKHVTLDR